MENLRYGSLDWDPGIFGYKTGPQIPEQQGTRNKEDEHGMGMGPVMN